MRLPLVLLLLLTPTCAYATQVLSMNLSAMVSQADVVIRARVVRTEPVAVTTDGVIVGAADAMGGGRGRLRYETRVDLDVIEDLMVDSAAPAVPARKASFHLSGGRIGRFAQVVAGTPGVVVGDEIVVILERSAASPILRVVGFSQGLWHTADLIGLEPLARSDRSGAELLPGESGVIAPIVDVRPLEALLGELRRVIATSKAAAPKGRGQ